MLREQIAHTRGRRYILPILAGPISMAPGVLNAMAVAVAQQEMVLNRTKRIVISGPILIATAIGTAAIAIAAGTAHVIATNEANKVLTEEKAHRIEDINNGVFNNKISLEPIGEVAKDMDSIGQTAAHSSHAFTSLNLAIQLNNKFNHLVSRKGTLEISDPSTEIYFNAIKKMNSRDLTGFTKSEVKEKTRLSADIATMTTTIIPCYDPQCGGRFRCYLWAICEMET